MYAIVSDYYWLNLQTMDYGIANNTPLAAKNADVEDTEKGVYICFGLVSKLSSYWGYHVARSGSDFMFRTLLSRNIITLDPAK